MSSISGYYIGHRINHSDKQFTYNSVESKTDEPMEFILNNLKKSNNYVFIVQAFNSKGSGPPSPEVFCRTLDKDPPSPPKITVQSTTVATVQIEWSPVNENDVIEGECTLIVQLVMRFYFCVD